MKNKKVNYRVIVLEPKVKGMASWFEKFTNDEDARIWAVEYGKKMQGDAVILSKKDQNRYNHYTDIKTISL